MTSRRISSPGISKGSRLPRIPDTDDTSTAEDPIQSQNVVATNRKDSVGSIKSSRGSVRFIPEVKVKMGNIEFNSPLSTPRPKNETKKAEDITPIEKKTKKAEHIIHIDGCSVCSSTTFQIESPAQSCDQRLKKFLDLLTKDVNGKNMKARDHLKGLVNKLSSVIHTNKSPNQNSTVDLLFEIRIIEAGINDVTKKWSTNFWIPRVCDPAQVNTDYGSFKKRAVHVLCPLEGERNCSNMCMKNDQMRGFKDFTRVENVEKMVFTKHCECEGAASGRSDQSGKTTLYQTQKWEVYLYERTRETSKQKIEDSFLDDVLSKIARASDPKDEDIPAVDRLEARSKVSRPQSLEGEVIIATTEEEAVTAVPKDGVELDNSNPQALTDEEASEMDSGW